MIVDDLKKSVLNSLLYGKFIDSNIKILKNDLNYRNELFPKDWNLVKVGDVIEIARGGSPRPIKNFLTESDDGINWIKIGDTEKGSKYINSCKEKIISEGVKKSRFVHKGDFLLSNSMSFGRPYILNIDGCIHDGWLVLTDKNNRFLKDFLFYVLSSDFVYKQFCDKASGAVVNNLNTDKVRETIIPLPPLEVQKQIVSNIEGIFEKLDEIKPIEEELLLLKNNFPNAMEKSILSTAFKGQLVKNNTISDDVFTLEKIIGSKNYKELDSSELPSNWKKFKFGDLFEIVNGFTPLRSNVDFWNNNEIPWFTVEDINEQGRMINYTRQYITKKALGNSSKRLLPKNTILLCCTASVGEYAITNIELTTNQQFNGLIIKENLRDYILPMYVFEFVKTLKSQLISKAGKTTFNFLSTKKLADFELPIPPMEEQKRIVDKLEQLLPLCNDIEKLVNS